MAHQLKGATSYICASDAKQAAARLEQVRACLPLTPSLHSSSFLAVAHVFVPAACLKLPMPLRPTLFKPTPFTPTLCTPTLFTSTSTLFAPRQGAKALADADTSDFLLAEVRNALQDVQKELTRLQPAVAAALQSLLQQDAQAAAGGAS